MAAAPAGHQLAIGQRANVVAPSSPKSVFTLPRLQEPDDLAADGAGRTDCSLQEGNRVAFEGSQAELGGGGDGLAEQLPGPLKITRLAAGQEHSGPLQPGAGQQGGGLDALVSSGGSGQARLGVVVPVHGGG